MSADGLAEGKIMPLSTFTSIFGLVFSLEFSPISSGSRRRSRLISASNIIPEIPMTTKEVLQPRPVIRKLAVRGTISCPAPVPTLTSWVTIPLLFTNQRAVVDSAITSMELRPIPPKIP